MKIKRWKHKNVKSDGTFKNQLGAVHTKPRVNIIRGGCGLKGCHCSDGYYLVINEGRNKNGSVNGLTVTFKNKEELVSILGG